MAIDQSVNQNAHDHDQANGANPNSRSERRLRNDRPLVLRDGAPTAGGIVSRHRHLRMAVMASEGVAKSLRGQLSGVGWYGRGRAE
jgi:hypothetical protein